MLANIEKEITITGKSIINNVVAERYTATIQSKNPDDISFSSYQIDKATYKANRTQCRKDNADFEDQAYALQDQMLSEHVTE